VQGADTPRKAETGEQRELVQAFLNALRAGDFQGLVAVLDPDVVVHIDAAAARPGAPTEIHGAQNFAKGAVTFSQMAGMVEAMLVNGEVGLVWAPDGRASRALSFAIRDGKIAEVEIIAEPARLRDLELAVLSD